MWKKIPLPRENLKPHRRIYGVVPTSEIDTSIRSYLHTFFPDSNIDRSSASKSIKLGTTPTRLW